MMRQRTARALALVVNFALTVAPLSAQQTPPAPASVREPQQQQPAPQPASADEGYEDEVVRITANLVQLDAVVFDENNRQVTDLKAEDFEILVDGKPQQITNLSYLTTQTPRAAASPAPTPATKGAPPPPPPLLKRSEVRRTVALVVDDLGLSFESTANVRRSLKKFVDEQMQPGDMAAIIRTSAGVGALQQFTTDKQVLHAAIDRVRWYPLGQGNASAFSPIQGDPFASLARDLANPNAAAAANRAGLAAEQQAAELNQFREELFSVGTLGALNFVVKGLRELPGRKSVVLFSDGIRLFNRIEKRDTAREDVASSGGNADRGISEPAGIKGTDTPAARRNTRVIEALRRLTDLASRSSVVIYTIDARGLQTLSLTAQDNASQMSLAQLQNRLSDRNQEFYETQEGLIYLARLTGGFAVQSSNDLNKAIGRILEEQQGYYLIGYRPDPDTFDPAKGRNRFHEITLRVKRPHLKVRTRTGFYGIPETDARSSRRTVEEQLAAALSSPFTSGGINLRLTALFGNDSSVGSVVRSVLHIDAHDLSFRPDTDGWQKATLDLVAFAYGDNGELVKQHSIRDEISIKQEMYTNALANGIVYSLDVPVRRAGAYQLRVAVRDEATGRVGSANQLVQVPNLGENRLALSGIYLSGRRLKAKTAATPTERHAASAIVPANIEEESEPDPQAIPAVRRFRHGMMLSYVYQILNARLDQTTRRPQLQTQVRLFREGQLAYEGKLLPFDPSDQSDLARLFAGGRLYLGTNLPPGEYILQVVVYDLLAPQQRRIATQWMNFELAQ